jgi:hypothetical protein
MKSPKLEPFRTRTLKVEDQGDYIRKQVIPAVRLKGKWLLSAGLNPGQYVTVTVISSGVLELRVCSPVTLTADDFRIMNALDTAMQRCDARKTGDL